jgi:Flp pilus assembly protein TadD
MFILVLVPVKPNLHPLLKERAHALAGRLPGANPGHRLDVVFDESSPGDGPVAGLEARVRHTAPIRQRMIDRHLKPDHEAVLWVDADLVAYPADLPTELLRRNPGGVSAPVVLLDHHPDRFYDVAGFVEQGRWARLTPPWFDQPGLAFDLDGVGCLYLVPAEVYRTGGRHVSVPGYTDHLAVCTHARRLGMPVRAYADLRAYHAFLPDFGEPFHEPSPGEGPARSSRRAPPPAPAAPPRAAAAAGTPGRSLTERLEAGLRLQQANRLLEAELVYRQVLRTDPDNIDATHLLGLIAHQAGRHEVAIDWIGRAVERAGPQPLLLNNLGEAYRAAGRPADAAACYEQALRLAPGLPQLHNNLGLARHAQGDFPAALRSFDEAVRLDGGYAKAHRNRGRALQELGRMAEAMACYDQARAAGAVG